LHGRWLFGESVSYGDLARMHAEGYRVKATGLTEQFDYDAFRGRYGPEALPLFVITKDRKLGVVTSGVELSPQDDEVLVSLVPPAE